MDAKLILFAVPVFFLFIGWEALAAKKRGAVLYRAGDTFANLSSGLGSQMIAAMTASLVLVPYNLLFQNAALVRWPEGSPWPWVLAFVGVDFLYYWWHRASHRVNLFWATHVVHHQSDEFNLSVALRQSWFGGLTSWPFYLPLALLGVPPAAFLMANAFALVYQFFIHTRLVGNLGWLEALLNTPSHHRVHHGSNPRYLDVNYGATLIVWDRLFGTFVPETETPKYGTVAPFRSFDAYRANIEPWRKLWTTTVRDGRWLAAIMPPGWRELASNAHLPELPSPTRLSVHYLVGETALAVVSGSYWIAAMTVTSKWVAALGFVWVLTGLALWSPWLSGATFVRGAAWVRNLGAIVVFGAAAVIDADGFALAFMLFAVSGTLWLLFHGNAGTTKTSALAGLLGALVVATVATNAVAEPGGPVAEAPQAALMPKLDAEGLRQLGPEHLQLIYCGAKEALKQMPENRKRLERLATEEGTKALFDKKGKADTSKMLDKSEAEAKRLVKDSAREYRSKAKKKISDEPCATYSAAIQRPSNASEAACHARYRFQLAEKLEAEVRSPAVASDFRERFREKLARDLAGAKQQLDQADAGAKTADASFDPSNCRFEKGIRYEPRRAGP